MTLLSMRPRYLDVYPVPNRGDLNLISLAEIVAGHLGGSYGAAAEQRTQCLHWFTGLKTVVKALSTLP